MGWVWCGLSLAWVSGSGGSDRVPSGVARGIAGLVFGGSFVGVDAGVWNWGNIRFKLDMEGVGWVWSSHGILWLSGSSGGDCVPSGVARGVTWLVLCGSLVGVNAGVCLWESVTLKSKLKVKSVSWIWGSHGILWLSGSSGGNSVPSGISRGVAWLIFSGGLVGINTGVCLWESITLFLLQKLKMESMSWIRSSHSILWLSSSGSGNGVPSRVTWGVAWFIFSSCLISVHTEVWLWKDVTGCVLSHSCGRDSPNKKSNY
jgi:hypothetical protein